jgi:sugar lactone lactonase YvrE
VADSTRGVLAVDGAGQVTVLVDEYDGERLLLVDDLDIASDGTIYFSDASRRFPVEQYILDAWEGRPTGRLLSFQPQSGETRVLIDGLMFANGVALGPEDAFVLVTETFAARVMRHWLTGPDRGKTEVFLEGLPGYPDNLSYNEDGLFWIALPSNRQSALENMAGRPFLRKLLMRMPSALREIELPPLGWVIAVDMTGKVRHNLQDHSGGVYTVTSVNEFNDRLYLGSIAMDSVGRFVLQN